MFGIYEGYVCEDGWYFRLFFDGIEGLCDVFFRWSFLIGFCWKVLIVVWSIKMELVESEVVKGGIGEVVCL